MKQCRQMVSEKSAEDYAMLAQDEAGVRLGSMRKKLAYGVHFQLLMYNQ